MVGLMEARMETMSAMKKGGILDYRKVFQTALWLAGL